MTFIAIIAVAAGAVAGFVRSAFRHRPDNHRPRLLELVEAQERKQLEQPPTFEQKCLDVVSEPGPIPMPAPPVSRMDREAMVDAWKYGTVRPGHAPSASDYARAVGMPVPSSGVARKG